MDLSDCQYIFQEEEFENNDFQAGAFLAKYRRVATLDSLRGQLHDFVTGLKQQLYQVINNDYKDFINISTKVSMSLNQW